MRFKSENQLREYWEKERKKFQDEFLNRVEKEGKTKEDERVKQVMELYFNLFLVNELESICQLYKEENRYRTDVEVSRHFECVLKPVLEIMWKG